MALKIWLPLNGDLHNQGLSDVTVTNNGATVNNSGKIGKCYSFAKNAYLDIDKSAMTDMTSASVCFWIKVNSWNTNWDTIFQAGTGATPWTAYYFGVLRNSSNSLCFAISNGSSGSQGAYKTDNLTVGEWCHVVCSYGDGKCRTYLNGELCNEYDATIVPNFSGITSIKVGGLASNYKCDCLLNDVRIYSHVLSLREIKEISKGLVLHYPLSDPYVEGTTNLLPSNLQNFTITNVVNAQLYIITTSVGGSYTLSGYVTRPTTSEGWVNPRITLYITYTDGTTTVKQDYGILVADGKERFFRLTVTADSSKAVSAVRGWLCDYSSGTTKTECTMRYVQLENKDHATPYTPSTRNENIVYDVSGYQNNGSVTGDLTCLNDTPRYNISTHISATNQKIHISNFPTSGFGNSYSFAWWGKRSSNSPMFWGFSDGIRLNGMYIGNLWNTGDGSSNPLYKIGTTTQVTAPSTGVWHHYVMTGNGTKCYVYLDGELWAEAKTYKSISGTSIYINGWDSGTSYCSSDTSISDFRIYSTALDAEQVKELYNAPASIVSNGVLMTQGEITEV